MMKTWMVPLSAVALLVLGYGLDRVVAFLRQEVTSTFNLQLYSLVLIPANLLFVAGVAWVLLASRSASLSRGWGVVLILAGLAGLFATSLWGYMMSPVLSHFFQWSLLAGRTTFFGLASAALVVSGFLALLPSRRGGVSPD
jgi:hypothetical protein